MSGVVNILWPLLRAVLADRLGRKLAIIIGGVVFFLGGAVQAGSFYIWYADHIQCLSHATTLNTGW